MTAPDTARASLVDRAEAAAAALVEAARRARRAMGDASVTDLAIARRWKPGTETFSHVTRLFTATSGVNITLAKILALPKDLARDILARALAALEDGDGPEPDVALGDLAIKLGVIAHGIQRDRSDDGLVNDHARHRDNFAAAMTCAARAYLAAQKRAEGGGR